MTVPVLARTAPTGPTGAPVVLLGPSIGTSTILWDTVIPTLARAYRVVAWDLPGHGASPAASAGFTVDDLADAVAEVAREVSDAPVLAAGVSLGGAVSLTLALRHPELVAGAGVIASGAQLGEPEAWHARAATVRAESTSAVIIGSAQRWFAPGSIERIPELSGRLLHALQDADDESYALCCEALAAYDVRGRLGEIVPAVLAAYGEFDQVAPESKAVEVARGVRDGTIERIADAAHLPPAEQPEGTLSALLPFFRDHAKGAGR